MRDFVQRLEFLYEASGSPLGKLLTKLGIKSEKASPSHSACSIGKSEKDGKWYGWSHRAIAGFGIGDKIFDEDFGDDDTPFIAHGEKTIRNEADAKQAAINFARHVS